MRDEVIFGGKKLSSLFEDIYTNSAKKRVQIESVVAELKLHIKNANDATVLVPIIKECLDVAVRNDEHLIKLATIVQRIMASENMAAEGSGGILTDAEKQALLDSITELEQEVAENDKAVSSVVQQQPLPTTKV